LPIDAEVARQFAHIVAALRRDGRRMPILDALVAATALVEQIPVVTQDQDYDAIPGVEVIRVSLPVRRRGGVCGSGRCSAGSEHHIVCPPGE
jgi:hypothetical protein